MEKLHKTLKGYESVDEDSERRIFDEKVHTLIPLKPGIRKLSNFCFDDHTVEFRK